MMMTPSTAQSVVHLSRRTNGSLLPTPVALRRSRKCKWNVDPLFFPQSLLTMTLYKFQDGQIHSELLDRFHILSLTFQ